MTFREAIREAIHKWNNTWFHWNKSTESKKAVQILERLMYEDSDDARLSHAVDWYLGRTGVEFSYVLPCPQLKTDSALYAHLTGELQNAAAPNLPRVSNSNASSSRTGVAPSSSRMGTGSSVQRLSVPVVSTGSNPSPVSTQVPSRHGTNASSSSNQVVAGPELPSVATLEKQAKLWKKIEITDRPTEQHGVYEHSASDFQTTLQKGAAAQPVREKTGCGKDEVLNQPEYWALLGRMVLKSKKGRCFSCAAAAVYSLVMDPECDDITIAVIGNETYDHHYIAVGVRSSSIKAKQGYAIDIWQSNLNGSAYVQPLDKFRYTKGTVKIFCYLKPKDRAGLRAWVEKAGTGND